eukprot:TRINITY_DN27412_c0_g1_i1.p1 TRINITY_DN27412_c0_g1~~TRINITY_DN27412_c0_g1_i1.p1  ORF type:complete len:288 (+),score=42.65 TRINITY_DN27412_c0_g1_i1:70-933(+)
MLSWIGVPAMPHGELAVFTLPACIAAVGVVSVLVVSLRSLQSTLLHSEDELLDGLRKCCNSNDCLSVLALNPSIASGVEVEHARNRGHVSGELPARSSRLTTTASSPVERGLDNRTDDPEAGHRRDSSPETVVQSNGQRIPDLELARGFAAISNLPDVHPAMLDRIRRAVQLLRSCSYPLEDICSVLTFASVYFEELGRHLDEQSPANTGNVVALLMFIAHSYIEDETCPLKVWHAHVFSDYCTIPDLNKVIMQILETRGFKLCVKKATATRRHACLLASARCRSQH